MPFTFKLSKRLALMKGVALALVAAAVFACELGDQLPTGPTKLHLSTTSAVTPGTVSDLRLTAASEPASPRSMTSALP